MNVIDLENNFFGRGPFLELLKKRIINIKEGYRQNVAFLGNRYLGKTSIFRKFMADLDDENIIVVYLDLDNKDFYYFFSKYVGSILYNFSKVRGLPIYSELDLLMESTKDFIPRTICAIKDIQMNMAKGKLSNSYRALISLAQTFCEESNKFCLIILDEFHNLDEMEIPNVFQDLGKGIMTQKRCLYVVSSSLMSVARKILSEKLSLLFGNFEVIEVCSFDLKTSQEFVSYNLDNIKIGIQLKNFLSDFTGGHPLYLKLICQELINLSAVHKQGEIFIPLLAQAIENAIFNQWGVLSRHFELIVNTLCHGKGNRVMSLVLMSLANGRHKLKEIIEDIGLRQSLIAQKINRLIELGIVVKNGNFYYLQDKLLKYWIKYVFQKRIKAVEFTPEKQRKQFKEEVHLSITNVNTASRTELSSRIVDLLHCFDNEAFSLNGRKYKLSFFKEIISVKLRTATGSHFEVIKAFCPEGVWFIVLKNDPISENDVNTFLGELRKLGQKPLRQVLISLADLDINTRLRALQARMWIWNEDELNTLLNFYDKPYIVR